MSYFLRTTNVLGQSFNGFQWPMAEGARVVASDWQPSEQVGNGLHGLKDGIGDWSSLSWADDAIWWLLQADDSIDLIAKHKFQSCTVVSFGSRQKITKKLYFRSPGAIHGLDLKVGSYATAAVGAYGTAEAGDYGTAIAGFGGTAIAGFEGQATVGSLGRAVVGDWGTATAGLYGTAMAGRKGVLLFPRWTTRVNGSRKVLVGYVGRGGIEPNVPYRANETHTGIVKVA